MEKIPAASAMDWSIDVDRGLRSRHPGTRLRALEAVAPRLRQLGTSPTAPAAVASAFGVQPGEARLFAETMLLRVATEFRSADNVVRARIVRSLLSDSEYRDLASKGRAYDGALSRARVAEPDQVLRRVTAVYDTGKTRARALALRMFGCLADLAKDSVHVRSLLLSSLCSSNAAEVKAALFAAGCLCKLSEDFSCITLEVLTGSICSPRSEAQVIVAAIKAFSELDCTLAVIHRVHEVGKQVVLGTLQDVFKAEMLFSLSILASKSIILFGDQFAVAYLLHVRGGAKGVTNGEDSLSPLHRGMQFLSTILQRFMELPFVVPKFFFRVRPRLGAELFIFDSNPVNRDRISVWPGFQLSLTLCLQWKCVFERTSIRVAKLYCILAANSPSRLDVAGTRSKQFEIHKTVEMVQLNTKLLQHIKSDLRKTSSDKNNFHFETDLVTAFACFEPAGSGQGFSDCWPNVSSFPECSYQIAWQACCVDEDGSYFSLLPLNDGVVFSIQKS